MRKIHGALVLGLLVGLAGAARAAEPFEGEVLLKTTLPYPVTIRYFIKGTKVLSVWEGEKTPMLFVDLDKLQAFNFLPDKTYTVVALKAPPAGKVAPGSAVKSGKKKVISGQSCEEWVDKSRYGTMRFWALPGFSFAVHPWSGSQQGQSMMDFLRTSDQFPVALISEDESGKVTAATEAIEIKRKKLDAAAVAFPAGYKPAAKK